MKLTFSKKSNLIEQAAYKYTIQDIQDPNLYRALFSYDEVPKIAFNHRHVPINMPEEIWLTDTTFRDGQQSREPYTVEQMLHIFDLLHRLGGDNGLIRQSEFFVYSKKDRDSLYKCMERNYKFPEVTTWIRAHHNDFKLVKDIGIKETGILVSCSDYHIFKKLGMSRRKAADHYIDVIKSAIEMGITPRCHLEDITRADFYGFVLPFVTELMELSTETGIPIKIRACDTMGYGVSFPGAALPRSVQGIIYGFTHYAGVSSEMIEWHGHNDFYKGVSNAATAWLYGCSAINCSILGIGERTGNVPLEAMVFEYAGLKGTLNGMDTTVITEIADYYEKELGYQIPHMTPFVGKNFNCTRAGIHADGLLKDEEIYNIFNTEKLLNRPVAVAVTNASGLAGIAYWVNFYFNLKSDDRVDKKDPLVQLIKKWADKEFDDGRETAISDEELLQLVDTFALNRFTKK